MRKRRLMIVVVVLVVVLLGAFVVFGIPLIQDMFTPPITGLPTTSASAGNSLQAQTALAKKSAPSITLTPAPQ
jgi:hypothetical protein